MPYIKKEQRPEIDCVMGELIEYISRFPVENHDGMVNYAVTKILIGLYPRGYFHYNRVMGVLECIKQEFYRRRVAEYENEKIRDNGDVYDDY